MFNIMCFRKEFMDIEMIRERITLLGQSHIWYTTDRSV